MSSSEPCCPAALTGSGCPGSPSSRQSGRRSRAAKPPPWALTLPLALAAAVTGTEELDRLGDDLDRLPLAAPVLADRHSAPVEAPLDRHRATLEEVVGAVLALRAPDGHVEVVGLVDPVAGLAVFAAAVDRDAQLADGGAAAGVRAAPGRGSGSR